MNTVISMLSSIPSSRYLGPDKGQLEGLGRKCKDNLKSTPEKPHHHNLKPEALWPLRCAAQLQTEAAEIWLGGNPIPALWIVLNYTPILEKGTTQHTFPSPAKTDFTTEEQEWSGRVALAHMPKSDPKAKLRGPGLESAEDQKSYEASGYGSKQWSWGEWEGLTVFLLQKFPGCDDCRLLRV